MVAEVQQHQSHRFWRAVGAVTTMALSLGLGSAAGAADKPSLTIDQRSVSYTLDDVVTEVQGACAPHPDEELTLHVQEPTYTFSSDIVCSAALAFSDKFIRQPLVKKAGLYKNARQRADTVIDLQESLPPTDGLTYDRNELIWSFARGEGFACVRAQSQKQIKQDTATAAQTNNETPEHWTVIEAVRDAGECPEKLPDLYRNVAALGNPTAANTVKQLLERKTVTLPLRSVPEGVSARTVDARPVFLNRQGDRVTTFRTDPHGTPGLHVLWWCPKEQLFVEPVHAETFDANGKILDGPAQRGLDRLKTTVKGGTVTVDLHQVTPGSTARPETSPPVDAGTSGAWNTSPQSFCFQAVKSG
jgi:hypothetical protein